MVKRSLTDKLKTGLYTGLAAGGLGLTGCGGGGNTETLIPPTRSINQTAVLVNSVDIDYNARLENVSSATITVSRNGTEIEQKTITNPNYSETLEELAKGNYEFCLNATGATTPCINVEVPNYNPEPDSSNSNLNLDMPPNSVLEVELKNPTDKNSEDNPVFYTFAESSKVNPILGPYSENTTSLTIESYGSGLGDYEIELKFGNISGGEGNEILEGRILEVPEQIAFWSNRPVPEGGYNEEIYSGDLINGILTNIQRLTTDPGQDLEPAYSPDGKELLFTSHRTRGTAVFRMDANGNNQRDITSNIVERARQADWCSNGKIAVAYRDLGDSVAGIGIIDPDGNSFTSIYSETSTGRIPGWPKWSPDCSEIAFQRYVNGNWEVYVMNSDGSNQRNLTNNPATDQLPDWSPDRNDIAFISDREGSLDIYKMSLDGSNVRSLTNGPEIDVDPAWSPDGSKMVFARDFQIYIMNSDDENRLFQLTFPSQGDNRYPTWKPN